MSARRNSSCAGSLVQGLDWAPPEEVFAACLIAACLIAACLMASCLIAGCGVAVDLVPPPVLILIVTWAVVDCAMAVSAKVGAPTRINAQIAAIAAFIADSLPGSQAGSVRDS